MRLLNSLFFHLGMAVMAMMAQIFLSKIAFLSGAALLIAKLALLLSTLVRNPYLTPQWLSRL
jgi:hypothetical protein